MTVARNNILKLAIGGGCVLGSLAFPPLLAAEGIGWGTILATALNSVAAGNTANAIDALIDGGEGGVSLENHDLTKAVGKAIAAVITLAAKQQQGKTRQYLEKIAAQAKDNWVVIAQQELTQKRYPELREAKLDQFLTPEEYQLTQKGNLTATEWGDIFIRLNMKACKEGGFPIPPEVRQQVAELLHTTFPKALRETLKEDFANDGKAFAGLTLQLLTRMQAQLSQLQASQGGINAEEFSQILQQFQELETQLRGTVAQQQAFFNQISRRIDSGFAEVCQQLGVMETTITGLLQSLEERLEELRQEVTEFRQEVRQGFESLHNQPGGRSLSKQEYRQRQNVLTQMRTEVESRLTQSIHRAAFVNLGKEQQPQQVQRPWDMSVKVGEQRSVQLPPQTTILDVFDNPTISGKFLILGKPGGGKTTTLLELAEALIERAEGDSDAPIPVILELSTWQEVTKPKFLPFGEREKYDPSIKEWVLSQLMSKGVSQEMGEQWLRDKELVLLLDGLDELQPERQGKCVQAINQFLSREFSPLHLVVCSRKEEYEVYEEMLQLNGAICLEDLTNEQIQNYFASVNLGEFWESINGSEKIIDFIRQPLFLAITSIAYQQIDVEEWRNCNTERRAIDYLLGVYRVERSTKITSSNLRTNTSGLDPLFVQNRLARIAKHFRLQPFISVDSIKMNSLAQQNHKTLQSSLALFLPMATCFIFLLNPFTLPIVLFLIWFLTKSTILLGILIILLVFLGSEEMTKIDKLYSFIAGISIIVLSYFVLNLPAFFSSYFVVIAYTGILSFAITLLFHFNLRHQNIKKSFTFNWKSFYDTNRGYLMVSFVILFFQLILVVFDFIKYIYFHFLVLIGNSPDPIDEWFFYQAFFKIALSLYNTNAIWFILAILIAASIAVGFLTENKNRLPKNKKGNAIKNSVITSLVLFSVGFCSGFIPGLFYLDVFLCIGIGLVIGLIFGLLEGYPCLNYFSLRLTLWLTGQMPWNITRFLDYCTERLILQRVGNRYRFIHRLVQEHFAKLEIEKE